MNRQQRRASQRKESKRSKTYTLTKEQLEQYVRKAIDAELKDREECLEVALNNAMVLMLTLPLEVLMDHYWSKSYEKRIPEFTQHVLDYYERWRDGELDMGDLKRDLWEYGHVRLEVDEHGG